MTASKTSAPAARSTTLRITPPAMWLALSGLLLMVVAGLNWAFFGHLPVTVRGECILVPTGGLDRARAPASGLITSLQVKLDDPVTSGQVVATIWPGRVAQSGTGVPPRGSGIPVVAPCDGQVLEVSNNENDWVEAGHSMIIVGGAASSLEAWAFMPYSKGWRVRSGMRATISLVGVAGDDYGFMVGRVKEVRPFPARRESLQDTLGDGPWINVLLAGDEPRVRITIALNRAKSPSGYEWTTGHGPPSLLPIGTMGTATIEERSVHPIEMVQP